eukprot:COSAG01_NODE_11562_length_1903_cov_1.379712_1_plen_401_part_00
MPPDSLRHARRLRCLVGILRQQGYEPGAQQQQHQAPGCSATSGRLSPPGIMPPYKQYTSYTGPGGTTAQGLVRECTMLKVRSRSLLAGYNEWHRQVWPDLQAQIRLSGATNYSIFQRPDGLLFLYMEYNPVLRAANADSADLADVRLLAGVGFTRTLAHTGLMRSTAGWINVVRAPVRTQVTRRWRALMDPFLDRDFEFNGPLDHVMYMDPDPASRTMLPVRASVAATPSLAPNPSHAGYDSFTGGGGWSHSGRTRHASQLKCRSDPQSMAAYREWHCKVWPELYLPGFARGMRNYSIFQRKDGLLFLYHEQDEQLAAASKEAPDHHSAAQVNDRWQAMMDEVGLQRDAEHSGPLEHVSYQLAGGSGATPVAAGTVRGISVLAGAQVMYIGDDRTMKRPF